MDDGYSPVSILVLIGFILLEAVFYGFGSAIQNVNEGKLEEEARPLVLARTEETALFADWFVT